MLGPSSKKKKFDYLANKGVGTSFPAANSPKKERKYKKGATGKNGEELVSVRGISSLNSEALTFAVAAMNVSADSPRLVGSAMKMPGKRLFSPNSRNRR